MTLDCKKLEEEIQAVFNEKFANLNDMLRNVIQVFADRLFSILLISNHVKESPTYATIINEVMSAMKFQKDPSEIVEHIVLFLKTMSQLGPPQQRAANSIAKELTECIDKKLKVKIKFTW